MAKDVKDIRITDPYVKKLVERERQAAGEGTSTRTAARLIIERVAVVDHARAPGARLKGPPAGNATRKAKPAGRSSD